SRSEPARDFARQGPETSWDTSPARDALRREFRFQLFGRGRPATSRRKFLPSQRCPPIIAATFAQFVTRSRRKCFPPQCARMAGPKSSLGGGEGGPPIRLRSNEPAPEPDRFAP